MNDITPKEAIANLNHLYGMVSPDMQRSLDVAIKVLERTTGDCISREALKDIAYINKGNFNTVEGIREWIDNAPTVPQVTVFAENADEKVVADLKAELQNVIETRPKGEWTTDEKGYFYCDKCGKYPHDQYATTDFCPKCGADMRKGGAE